MGGDNQIDISPLKNIGKIHPLRIINTAATVFTEVVSDTTMALFNIMTKKAFFEAFKKQEKKQA